MDSSVVVGFHHLFPNTSFFHPTATHFVMGSVVLYALSQKKSLWAGIASF